MQVYPGVFLFQILHSVPNIQKEKKNKIISIYYRFKDIAYWPNENIYIQKQIIFL